MLTLLAAVLILVVIVGPVLVLVALDRRTARTEPGIDWEDAWHDQQL